LAPEVGRRKKEGRQERYTVPADRGKRKGKLRGFLRQLAPPRGKEGKCGTGVVQEKKKGQNSRTAPGSYLSKGKQEGKKEGGERQLLAKGQGF